VTTAVAARRRRPQPPHPHPSPHRRRLQPPDTIATAAALRSANAFELTARLIGRDVLRYTPSGIPLVDCVLEHGSERSEAGQLRQVALEIPAVAFETVAQRLTACRLEETYRFSGFLANRSQRSKRTVFHITEFE
jgi:primosomal replication protein N